MEIGAGMIYTFVQLHEIVAHLHMQNKISQKYTYNTQHTRPRTFLAQLKNGVLFELLHAHASMRNNRPNGGHGTTLLISSEKLAIRKNPHAEALLSDMQACEILCHTVSADSHLRESLVRDGWFQRTRLLRS